MSSASPAVGRSLELLMALAARTGPVGAATLARELNIPRSTVYHLLDVLIKYHFVVYLPAQHGYGLGVAAFEIGSAYMRREPLELLARPVLRRLVDRIGETAHLGVLHGAETLYLIKEQPAVARMPVTLVTDVGVRLPAQLTASGRSMLAHLPAAQVRALFPSNTGFVVRTGRGPTSLPQLRNMLAEERAQGWAEEDGLITEGLHSVAACAFDHSSRPVAAISVTRRTDRSSVIVQDVVREVRHAAQQLTWAMSGVAPQDWFETSPPHPAAP
ncbi:transcriptional regulator [Mycobacteroides abscessus subsp. bolletii]|nr:transcriptional regulator [Mycobacteroides abscessus subsp. bolletii]SHT32841.1 transcriptional regulator [Mycobacteroides abscessus subsp. bolletii]SHT51084.1 transcriptional regulator [Mycobacteroides abscessus subsp. bolletii]SKG64152.1 transcriptional regulator [Mycobacteroides abscessus subsp. bolletii]SKH19411.1 transcriptional regulator [Mycobacteroides abscessus subsp. bolletii]